MATVPADYIEDEYEERIQALGGQEIPLNIFLYQEVQRLQAAILKVRQTFVIVMQAIRGEVVVTAEIMDSINAIFDARVPKIRLYRYVAAVGIYLVSVYLPGECLLCFIVSFLTFSCPPPSPQPCWRRALMARPQPGGVVRRTAAA